MEKQYNEELVMNLVKALEIALPEGMSVLVGGSAEPSDSREDWMPCEDEEEEEEVDLCDRHEECAYCDGGDCDGYPCYDGSCPYEDEDEEPHANMERIREMLEDIAKLVG